MYKFPQLLSFCFAYPASPRGYEPQCRHSLHEEGVAAAVEEDEKRIPNEQFVPFFCGDCFCGKTPGMGGGGVF